MNILKRVAGKASAISKKRLRLYFFIFSGVGIFALIMFFISFANAANSPYNFHDDFSNLTKCGDGTSLNSCSVDKPYYCRGDGILIRVPSACGCPGNLTFKNNSCVSSYETSPKTVTLYYVLDGNTQSINFTFYGNFSDYLSSLPDSLSVTDGKIPTKSDFIFRRINESNQAILLEPLVKSIENLAPNNKVDQARIAVSIVQNIPWGSSGKEISLGGKQIGYTRYPYQVLYDNQGLCGEKSELLAFILRDLGYGTALFYYPKENHETVGIKCPWRYSLDKSGYCFIETSGPAIISDSKLVYEGGVQLISKPEIIHVSDGISLPSGLYEYNDARTLNSIKLWGWINPSASNLLKSLDEKYGLNKVYNIK